MRVAVSGVAGFLGSHIARRLQAAGNTVIGIDQAHPSTADRLRDVPVEYHWGDVRDAISRIAPVDAIIHCASVTNIGYAWANPYASARAMGDSCIAIAEAMQLGWAKKCILISTHSVYGRSTGTPFSEVDVAQPMNFYGVLKLQQEQTLLAYARAFGIDVTVLRMALMYGEAERADATPRRFVEMALAGQTIRLEGGGRVTRDFNYVGNAVDAIELALDAKDTQGEIYNISSGENISIRDLARAAIAFAERGETIDVPERPGEEGNIRLNFAKAFTGLGYNPVVDFDSGFRKSADWTANNLRRD
jgi:nucleoside-diphosphate-sugar epimerase